MKNVTISMDDTVLSWVRVEAAKRGESVSRFIASLVRERREVPTTPQSVSLERFLAQSPAGVEARGDQTPSSSRDEIYDDALLHRFQHPDLSPRSAGPGED